MKTKKIALIITAGITALVLGGCGEKMVEPYQDAKRGNVNTNPADIMNFPDGFSNVSTKCDGPNRVYVIFKGDNLYGSIAVVANDPRCTR